MPPESAAPQQAHVKARLLPRDLLDFAVLLLCLPLGGFIGLLPALIGLWLFGNDLLFGLLTAILVLYGIVYYVVGALFLPWSAVLSSSGFQVRRLLGKPRQILLSEIVAIRPVSRRAVFRAWALVWWPPKSRSLALTATSKDVFEVVTPEGAFLFPPDDPAEFRRRLRTIIGDSVLTSQQQGVAEPVVPADPRP